MKNIAILPTISTSCIVISAILVAFGWYYIKKRKIETHKKLMILAAVFACIFFAIYSFRTVFIGNTAFGGPDDLKTFYHVFLYFHITLATVGAILGIRTIWLGLKNQLDKHKKYGPVTSIVWFCTGLTGIVVYFLLYVLYPGGETTSLLKAIFGF